jgi:hypothetical protein
LIKDTNALGAYGQIADLASKAMTDLYRRKKIREMIAQASNSFPTAVSNLQHLVTVNCVLQLEAEKRMLATYYIDSTRLDATNTPPWARTLVMEVYRDKLSVLEQKIEDCKKCGVILGKMQDGYQALLKNVKHLDAKELESTLKGYEQAMSAAYAAIKKLK